MAIEPQKFIEDLIPKCKSIRRFFNEVIHFKTDDNCYILSQRDSRFGMSYNIYDTLNNKYIFFSIYEIDRDFIDSFSKYDTDICLNTLKVIK